MSRDGRTGVFTHCQNNDNESARMVTLLLLVATVGARADSAVICLTPPTVQLVSGAASQTTGDAVRQAFAGLLTGPGFSTVQIAAKLPTLAKGAAKQAGCGSVLFLSLRQVRGGPSDLLGKLAGRVESQAQRMAVASRSSLTRDLAREAAGAVREVAGSVKARDQMVLEYRLESVDGAVLAKDSASRKASADGEDLLTPLAEVAAEAVAVAVTKS